MTGLRYTLRTTFLLFLLLLIFCGAFIGSLSEKECLLVIPKKSNVRRVYFNVFKWQEPEDSYGRLKDYIVHGATVEFMCKNGFVKNDFPGSSYVFECVDGKFNGTLNYEDLLCKSNFHVNTQVFPISNIQLGSRIFTCQGKGLEVYEVGVKANETFRSLYKVCFDKSVMRVKFTFQPKRLEVPAKRNDTRQDVWGFDYFGANAREKFLLSSGYVAKTQKRRITAAFPEKYNKNKMYPYYFNRGHLAPFSDFVQPDDRRASCEYINVAPQWREFNGNSWSVVERITRELVSENASQWEIYTGVYGSIPTQKGPLFVSSLQHGKFPRGYVPVPKLFWKFVHNTEFANKSRAYVGVNNPELTSPEQFGPGYLICKPKRLPEGTYFRGSEFKGFFYQCDVDEFLAKLAKDENIVKVNKHEF